MAVYSMASYKRVFILSLLSSEFWLRIIFFFIKVIFLRKIMRYLYSASIFDLKEEEETA